MPVISSAQLITDANTHIEDNTSENVNPEDVRLRVIDIADSFWNRSDTPQASALELAALTETAVRLFSPADLKDAMHTLSDLDEDTLVEVARTPDVDRIYMQAGGVDMAEIAATFALIGTASTGVKVEPGVTNLITLDGELLLQDFPNTRDDGTTSKALFVDASGNVQYGTVTASAGARIQDADNDTYITVEPTADSDTVEGYAYDGTASRQWLSVDTTGAGLIQFGRVWSLDNFITIDGGNDTTSVKSPIVQIGDLGDVHFRVDSGTGLAEVLGGNFKLGAYPNTRDDGPTTKALYVSADGTLQYGTVTGSGSGGTSIQDADGDTLVEVERTADDDTVYLRAAGVDMLTVQNGVVSISDGSTEHFRIQNDFARLGEPDNSVLVQSGATNLLLGQLDGIEVLRFGVPSSAPRFWLGDSQEENNGAHLYLDDGTTLFDFRVGVTTRFRASNTDTYLGGIATNYLRLQTSDGLLEHFSNGVKAFEVLDEQVTLGQVADTGLLVDSRAASDFIRMYSQGKVMLEVNEENTTGRLRLGDYAEASPTYIDVRPDADTFDFYAGGTQLVNIGTSNGGQIQIGNIAGGNYLQQHGTETFIAFSSRRVFQAQQLVQRLGDYLSTGNGTRLEVDDTAQTFKAIFGANTLLNIGASIMTMGSSTVYVQNNAGTDTIRLEAGTVLLDQHKARTDTEQDYALTLDASGNLNRAKVNAYHSYPVAMSDLTTDLVANTLLHVEGMHMPFKFRLEDVMLGCELGPVGAALIVDIHLNGTTIFSTKIQIDSTQTTSVGSAVTPVFSAGSTVTINKGDKLEFFIDQVGSTIPGLGLKCYLNGTKIP